MGLRDDLVQGLKAADAAGDTAAAQHFATQLQNIAEPVSSLAQQTIRQNAPPLSGRQLMADRMLETGQGAALGWGDELAGVVGGLDSLIRGKASKYGQDTFSGGYNATVGQARKDLKDYEVVRPLEALGMNVVGSLPTIAAAAPELAGKGFYSTVAKMGQALKTGAKVGAIAGAGYGDGDLTQRAGGAATGALTGGLLGLALPAVPAAVGGMRRAVTALRQPAEDFAHNALANTLDKDAITSLDASKPLIDQVPTGSATEELAEQAALSGEGRSQARKFFKSDEKAREGTVLGTVNKVVSDAPMYDVMDDLQAQRTTDAAPLYQAAYNAPYRRTPRLMDLINRPATGGALRAAYTRLQNDPNIDPADVREALGPIMGDNPDDLTDAQLAQRMTQAMGKRPLEFKALDYVKRGLDAMVQDNPGAVRETRQLRNAYRDELKNVNPAYQSALNAWAGPSAVLDAVEQGREFDSMDPEAITRALNGMSDSEQQGFQVGVSRRLQDLASGAKTRSPGQNTSLSLSRGIADNSVMQRRLQAALGSNGQNAPQLLQRNGWRPTSNGVFTNTTQPGTQITVNGDGTWSAGQISKSGKSTSLVNSGPDQSTLESYLTGKPLVDKPGASSVDDLINMATGMVDRANKGATIIGNSATARREAGTQTFNSLGGPASSLAASVAGGPGSMSWHALRLGMSAYLNGLTSARRAAVSKLLYSDNPQDNQAAIDAIERIRAGKTPTQLQQRMQQGGNLLPAAVGAEAGRGGND